MPPLNAVRAFEAAARLGSYVAASQALHVTQPAIGRHVKNLENWLGLRLLERTPRGVTLTLQGAHYYKAASEALQILADAGMRLAQRNNERWLRILCVPAFASRWLTPRIETLRSLRPDLKIAIEPNATFTAVDARQADLGIAYGLPGELSGVREVLIRPEVFPVCSPGYLARLPSDLAAENLPACRLIHVDDGTWWNSWFAANGLRLRVKADTSHMSNDIALNLAQRGHGIALATEVLVARELQDGALVRCVEQAVPLESYQLLIPAQQQLSADALWFMEWLGRSLWEAFPGARVEPAAALP
ncbi:LysR substrate-binding domain-containing protein [Pseudomonas guariconensis]|uniref:LysR substrate-binding domain-containing protein n=1 Tax=Pseudomonas TaxID=286 RepID=UPI001CE3D2FE|nr:MULTISPECIES: LysR substrate-binding domain-containing protein [Pseudomonas]MCO7637520.1 LysR substrate-binding domain-containing protein [Pseudomonas sp. S 311-6]MCO7513965.1 LysR substrate-binding domain-containing protein [Pseudomonas putida]MCO7563976.1 LysR substrate-binding domain-containing protein [Pseudomonas mosselii]MCO7593846.1 LysR substrate-binding domain-containing protein [Pseudomonas guariconensis]MCO7604971.1 LysR substrate-binding domain-containing protein [Pseudomonas gu